LSARVLLTLVAALTSLSVGAAAQRAGAFAASRDHPAIAYSDGAVSTAVTELVENIGKGRTTLTFDPVSGYLRSVLDALGVPIESQVLVYSETSFQARKINRQNPRAVFFTDRVAVGWVRGGDILEIAAQDPRQGTVFYQLPQREAGPIDITRNDQCLACHLSWDTLAVPGPLVLSVQPRRSNDEYANGGIVNHTTPLAERWGGWFVTGARVPAQQMGNLELLQPAMPSAGPKPVPAPASVDGLFDLRGYPTPHSDVVALMVLEHQAHATNLITRAGWEYRVATSAERAALLAKPKLGGEASDGGLPARVVEAVDELVDYFLFVDEAPLPAPIRGSSGFAEKFAGVGPRDRKGRSLRDLQLETRLMRYPCSYMIYSPAFEGLPPAVKAEVLARISSIVSGRDARQKFAHLTPADRAAIAEILRDTSPVSVRHFL
jgi:hypothetical protein